jgi:hypothetical protein
VTLAIGILLVSGSGVAAPETRAHFASPEAAATALVDAAQASDEKKMLGILGPDARSLISSGDKVADRHSRERFVRAYEDAHQLIEAGAGKVVVHVGKDGWPLPIPLVRDAAGWWFDTAAGKEEILRRRIGRNELNAIQVCLAYVDAQREYYVSDPDNDKLLQYAQRFRSRPGKRDGLYWDVQPGGPPSPLGALVARAEEAGYPTRRTGRGPSPYWGYYYHILKMQGPHARGGAYDYVVRGHMIGGFALVAYPAGWGSSGIMTFIVNHEGIFYQKDLGPGTKAIAQAMTTFDPDDSWERP